jgi:hypothetical protein
VNVARSRWVDGAIAAVLCVAAAWWGTHEVRAMHAAGLEPSFYQELFEPAVMTACGRGFHVAANRPVALTRFLSRTRDRLPCGLLPADLELSQGRIEQGAWLYLMLMVAGAWKLLGVSWTGLAPLFGLLFGLTTACVYVIVRFGMGRVLAVACTAAMALSTIQLANLLGLRDYARAPFMLACIAIVMMLTLRPFTPRRLLIWATVFGVIVGIGYGFRPDAMVQIPLLVITTMCFLPVPLLSHLRAKAAALAAACLAFLLCAWPVFHASPATGNNFWHVALIGFMPEYGEALGVENTTYHWGVTGSDEFVQLAVGRYWRERFPERPPLLLLTAEYETATRSYLEEYIPRFPGDMVTRTVASIGRVAEVPFGWPNPLLSGGRLAGLYRLRKSLLAPLYGWGIVATLSAIAVVIVVQPRVGLFLLTVFVYLGGYPVIEFQHRHFFYLEFIGWLALGFLATQLVKRVRARRIFPEDIPRRVIAMRAVVVVVAIGLAPIALAGLRAFQNRLVHRTVDAYLGAPRRPLALSQKSDQQVTLVGSIPAFAGVTADTRWAAMLRVELDASACRTGTLTFQYDRQSPYRGLTRSIEIPQASSRPDGRIVFFEPVYSGFASVDLVRAPSACAIEVSQVTGLDSEPIWLTLVLRPGWDRTPLYQQILTRAVQ